MFVSRVLLVCFLTSHAIGQFDFNFPSNFDNNFNDFGNGFDGFGDGFGSETARRSSVSTTSPRPTTSRTTTNQPTNSNSNPTVATLKLGRQPVSRSRNFFDFRNRLKSFRPFSFDLFKSFNRRTPRTTKSIIVPSTTSAPVATKSSTKSDSSTTPQPVRLQKAVPLRATLRPAVTRATVNKAIRAIRKLVVDNMEVDANGTVTHPFNAGLLRLGFHDCVSGCDGCINHANEANRGLEAYTFKLDDLYLDQFFDTMTRADFYALAAITAAKYAAEFATCEGRGCIPDVEFKWGRQDCRDPNSQLHTFPELHGDADQFFRGQFGLNREEFVAILGAHSLGKVHDKFGEDAPWTSTPDQLDNKYYKLLLDETAGWKLSNRVNPELTNSWTRANNTLIMLGSDASLVSNMDFIEKCVTDFTQCHESRNRDTVRLYASDNKHFLRMFSTALEKMLHKTNDGGFLREVVE